ncbi:hypothetical protein BROUX41_001581 [Berkeleyomyces rouxiae]|uniref:uncharacterized protein n=1 Tax=Berkeleyomyces rouxiae TaxID=2035830 RepID=UPI003B817949
MAKYWFSKSTFPVSFPPSRLLAGSHEAFIDALIADTALSQPYSGSEGGPFAVDDVTPEGKYIQYRRARNEAYEEYGRQKIARRGAQNATAADRWRDDRRYCNAAPKNMTRTDNGDPAFKSSLSGLVDAFTEFNNATGIKEADLLLSKAWAEDPLKALKIIFYMRSIHLGKGERISFYNSTGWLYKNHPRTLIANIHWLGRPVIAKKLAQDTLEAVGADDIAHVVDGLTLETAEDELAYDIATGVAHGFWKDLLNVLVLALTDSFAIGDKVDSGSPLTIKMPKGFAKQEAQKKDDDSMRQPITARDFCHARAIHRFTHDPRYCALHTAVARAFATQLARDLARLRDTDAKAKRFISLCAKWAPSHGGAHDKKTFIVSTIAEAMYPEALFADEIARDAEVARDAERRRVRYLWLARDRYRRDVSTLRAHLEVLERFLSSGEYSKIKYDRLATAALRNNAPKFLEKDRDRFLEYLERVAKGRAKMSGATATPGLLVKAHLKAGDEKMAGLREVETRINNGQWETLVQRIKDSGTLSAASIAVCDVSGSMTQTIGGPGDPSPLEHALGLSLLISEVCPGAFGGKIISFTAEPKLHEVDVSQTFSDKIDAMMKMDMGYNTDFVAVFDRLLLSAAVRNKVPAAEMPKRVFVFTDMQFDECAAAGASEWTTSFQAIQKHYADAGYAMPEMVFWNLAGRAGAHPVQKDEPGTAMLSGFSQAMLKVFLEGNSFGQAALGEELVKVEVNAEGDVVVQDGEATEEMTPTKLMEKAISHRAFDMLRVID